MRRLISTSEPGVSGPLVAGELVMGKKIAPRTCVGSSRNMWRTSSTTGRSLYFNPRNSISTSGTEERSEERAKRSCPNSGVRLLFKVHERVSDQAAHDFGCQPGI